MPAPSPLAPNRPRQTVGRGWLSSSLPPKTFLGFTAAVFALLAMSLLTYRTLEERAAGGRRLRQSFDVRHGLESLLSTIKDAELGERGYLLTGIERFLEPYASAEAELQGEFADTRRALGDARDQLERLDGLQRMVHDQMTDFAHDIDRKRVGSDDVATDLERQSRAKLLMDQIRRIVGDMQNVEQERLEARSSEWERIVQFSATVTWGGSALLLFLIGVAAVMSSRDFREQRVQAWLQSGQNQLARRMQGEQSMEMLGDNVASFLCEYLEAQLGAVYFADRAQLARVGAYGLSPARQDDRSGGGLTRQAYDEGRLISVLDLPDDYFEISSGLGRSKPRQLVIAPTRVEGVVDGVVELGFFRPLAAHDLDLLARAGDQIGSALRSCRYRSELKNLLDETQRQAEELQTQQEELRVQNEELEQQARSLQESQARLENQKAELEQINSQLEEQTQALERQRDNLAKAQGELQRANTYKSEFLANMSHELRTPLNSALILAKLLFENREGNLTQDQIKFAQTIYSAGNDLLILINDILDLSKIEAGKLEVRPETVPLQRVVDELLDTFQSVAGERHLQLNTVIEDGTPQSMFTDRTRLEQILKNLLSNALKFTEQGGVTLRIAGTRDGRVGFVVEDTGIGIALEQQEVIFEAFRQADGTTNRKYGGTGLGLSISRDLARLLGGTLDVESVVGRGSTFTLVLPERIAAIEPARDAPHRAPAMPRRAPVAAPRATSRPAVPNSSTSPENSHPADDRGQVTPSSRAVLVIEDDDKFSRVVQDLVRELEFRALVAYSAEDGLALAIRYRPSAIVLDVGLPDRSGLSVLDALKHDPRTRHIPVHMVSVSDYTQTALEMGAAGYAIKPVKRELLVEALRRLEAKFTQKLRRVLVVEDDDIHRNGTARLLAADNVQTVAVGTAAEALEELSRSTFDCMVLDLSLPDRTGFDLLSEMAQKEQYAFPPVVVYTGRSLSRQEEQELRRYSSSIIIKGARSPERLLDEVTLFLHQVESELPPDRQRMLRDARHREAVFEGRRVLVVEDDVRNIFALTSVLEPKGAKVEIARNGKEALAHLQEKPGVDLVLMDVMMSEMDGLEATRQIRKRPEYSRLPIIALTAKAMADDRDQCIAAGANDYIAKPFDVDKLLSLARVWMPK